MRSFLYDLCAACLAHCGTMNRITGDLAREIVSRWFYHGEFCDEMEEGIPLDLQI